MLVNKKMALLLCMMAMTYFGVLHQNAIGSDSVGNVHKNPQVLFKSHGELAESVEAPKVVPLGKTKLLIFGQKGNIQLYNLLTRTATKLARIETNKFVNIETVTPLKNGAILITGSTQKNLLGDTLPIPFSKLFNPANNSFQDTEPMHIVRFAYTATSLSDGKVLIAGGGKKPLWAESGTLGSLEVYDPSSKKYSLLPHAISPRFGHQAFEISKNKILFIGGYSVKSSRLILNLSVEEFDVVAGKIKDLHKLPDEITLVDAVSTLPNERLLLIVNNNQSAVYDPAIQNLKIQAGPVCTDSLGLISPQYSTVYFDDNKLLLVGGGLSSPMTMYGCEANIYNMQKNKFIKIGNAQYFIHPAIIQINKSIYLVHGSNVQQIIIQEP